MMKSYNKENLEKVLIRSGDLLNSLGILRSVKINNGTLKKEEYLELIKKNYLLTKDIPLPISNKINSVWQEAIKLFEEIGINNKSTSKEIKVKEICLFPETRTK